MSALPWFLKPTGNWEQVIDVRYWLRHGDRVRIIAGLHQAKAGTISSVAPQQEFGAEPRYHVHLDGGDRAMVQWDHMRRVQPGR